MTIQEYCKAKEGQTWDAIDTEVVPMSEVEGVSV